MAGVQIPVVAPETFIFTTTSRTILEPLLIYQLHTEDHLPQDIAQDKADSTSSLCCHNVLRHKTFSVVLTLTHHVNL
jgi:hypothetical protein